MKKYWLLSLLVLVTTNAEAKLMDLGYFELDNGLQVAVIENHKAPVALAMVHYRTGSVNDPNGQGGIAHLLEHMMFRGTTNLPKQAFNRLADEHGAENNAYTTYDETAYYEFADVSKIELMLAMEAERMENLTIDDKDFLKERDVVLQERMQRFETKPTPLFYEMLNKNLWQNHPLAKPVSGSVEDINGLTADDARAFYHKYYSPNNALLVIAGDVTIKEAKILAKKYFGDIPVKEKKGELTWEKLRQADTEMSVRLEGIKQPRYVQYIRLEKGTLSKKDVLALDLLTNYFTGDDTEYLMDELVYKDKKMLGIETGIGYDAKLGGTFSIYAVPADETMTLKDIKKIIWDKIESGYMLLSAEKLEKLKHTMLADAVYLQENPQSAARFVGGMLMGGYTAEEIKNYDQAIKDITLKDISAAWKKVRASESQISGYLQGRK